MVKELEAERDQCCKDADLFCDRLEVVEAERDALQQKNAELVDGLKINGDTSDGYHTFNKLYEFRKIYEENKRLQASNVELVECLKRVVIIDNPVFMYEEEYDEWHEQAKALIGEDDA